MKEKVEREKGESERTYISFKLEECLIVMVGSEVRMRGKSLEEHLVHGNRLLECGQILPLC